MAAIRNGAHARALMRSQDGALQPMRVIVVWRLRTAADCRPTVPAPLEPRESHLCIEQRCRRTRSRTDHGANAAIRVNRRCTTAGGHAGQKCQNEKGAKCRADGSAWSAKKCAAEWKEAKAANKIEKGTSWPKFWSDCNKRLKSASK